MYNLLKRKTLKALNKNNIKSILVIILIVISSLWVYEIYYFDIKHKADIEFYNKIKEEHQSLLNEIKNLTRQNKTLIKVLELKKDLE